MRWLWSRKSVPYREPIYYSVTYPLLWDIFIYILINKFSSNLFRFLVFLLEKENCLIVTTAYSIVIHALNLNKWKLNVVINIFLTINIIIISIWSYLSLTQDTFNNFISTISSCPLYFLTLIKIVLFNQLLQIQRVYIICHLQETMRIRDNAYPRLHFSMRIRDSTFLCVSATPRFYAYLRLHVSMRICDSTFLCVSATPRFYAYLRLHVSMRICDSTFLCVSATPRFYAYPRLHVSMCIRDSTFLCVSATPRFYVLFVSCCFFSSRWVWWHEVVREFPPSSLLIQPAWLLRNTGVIHINVSPKTRQLCHSHQRHIKYKTLVSLTSTSHQRQDTCVIHINITLVT